METETVVQYRFMYGSISYGGWNDLTEEIILPELSGYRMGGKPYMQTRTITREKPKPLAPKICGALAPFEIDGEELHCEGLEHGPELRHKHYYLANEHEHDPVHCCAHTFYWD